MADDWSQDCLEYFYNNKIFFPDIVRPSNFMKSHKSILSSYFEKEILLIEYL